MSYTKRYLEWALDKLDKAGFGTEEECMDYMESVPNDWRPTWLTVEAYLKETGNTPKRIGA